MSTDTTDTPELTFTDSVMTAQSRGSSKPNPFMTVVGLLPVTDKDAVERPSKDVVLKLSGVLKEIGSSDRRRKEDETVTNARRDLDAAGLAHNVTVKKQIHYGTLNRAGKWIDKEQDDATYALIRFSAVPRQVRRSNTADATTDTTTDTAQDNVE